MPEDRIHERFLTEYPSHCVSRRYGHIHHDRRVGRKYPIGSCRYTSAADTKHLDVQQFNLLYRPVQYMKTKVSLIGKPD